MSAADNKQTAQAAYAAFSQGDAEGAMRSIDDSVEWNVRGDNALTGKYKGRQAVGELWGRFLSRGFQTHPREFIADADKVVVLASVQLDGEQTESVDVLTYDDAGKLIAFDTFGDPAIADRAFPK